MIGIDFSTDGCRISQLLTEGFLMYRVTNQGRRVKGMIKIITNGGIFIMSERHLG